MIEPGCHPKKKKFHTGLLMKKKRKTLVKKDRGLRGKEKKKRT